MAGSTLPSATVNAISMSGSGRLSVPRTSTTIGSISGAPTTPVCPSPLMSRMVPGLGSTPTTVVASGPLHPVSSQDFTRVATMRAGPRSEPPVTSPLVLSIVARAGSRLLH